MAMSFLALLSLTVCGYGLCHRAASRYLLTSNRLIEVGLGFFIAAATVGAVFSASRTSISQWSMVLAGISGVISILIIGSWFTAGKPLVIRLIQPARLSKLGASLLAMIAAYLLLILMNNLYREIFPWDAFTTWIYRSKAWVLTQSAADFAPLDQWLRNDGTGLTLAAAHYPIGVSAIAAFSSSLSGGWHDPSASIPWFFASLASALLVAGLCRLQHPRSAIVPMIGATALITTPMVHMHGLLAGYADLWVMGTSGMGLAGLCIGIQQRSSSVLALSFVLLLLGCFFKIEGWLWLALGGAAVAVHCLWRRFGQSIAVVILPMLLALGLLQPLNLGPLGEWGIGADGIMLGALGTIGFRPYNPIGNYLTMTFWQGNFLLLVPLYLAALLAILFVAPRKLSGYLLMGGGVVATHVVIFGLSGYSEYAQLGTAINRVLLQTLPVFIITISAVVPGIWDALAAPAEVSASDSIWAVGSGTLLTLIIAALALPLSLALLAQVSNITSGNTHTGADSDRDKVFYRASELKAVLGSLTAGNRGYQFTGSDIPIGVAKPEMDSPGIQPRYVVAESWMATPETVSFYWINTDTPRVHSVPIEISGQSVIDMASYPDFWRRPIREMGYLVQPSAFETTALGSLTLTDSLFDALPALAHHWASPAPLSQRLINMTTGHGRAPIALHGWLTMTFFMMLGVALCLGIPRRNLRAPLCKSLFTGVSLLWLMGSLAHANQAIHLTTSLWIPAVPTTRGSAPDGSHLQPLATAILKRADTLDQPMLALGVDGQGRFDAHRMPFMLLPISAAAITEPQLTQISPRLAPTVLVFGQNSEQLNAVAQRLIDNSNWRIQGQGKGYVMLGASAQ